jgi:hypothetical protein
VKHSYADSEVNNYFTDSVFLYGEVSDTVARIERQRNPGTMVQIASSFPHFADAQCGLQRCDELGVLVGT